MTKKKEKPKPKPPGEIVSSDGSKRKPKPKSLRTRRTPQNSQQQKIQNLSLQLRGAEKKRKEYFEEATLLKRRNQQLLKEREQHLAQMKIMEDKSIFYDHMLKLGLDLNEFFTSEPKVLDKHSDIIAIKEKVVE